MRERERGIAIRTDVVHSVESGVPSKQNKINKTGNLNWILNSKTVSKADETILLSEAQPFPGIKNGNSYFNSLLYKNVLQLSQTTV